MRWLFVVLALLPLAVDFGALRPYEPIKIVLFEIAVASALAVAAVIVIRRRRPWRSIAAKLGSLDAAVALYFSALALGTIFSVDPARSFRGTDERLTGLLWYAALTVCYFLVRLAIDERDCSRFMRALTAASVPVSAYGLLQWLGYDLDGLRQAFPLYGLTGPMRAFSTLGHPVFLGTYLAMVMPMALHLGSDRAQLARWRLLGALAFVLAGSTVLVTYSRAAWFAALGAAAAYLLLRRARTSRFYLRATVISGMFIVVFIGGLWLIRQPLLASPNAFLYRLGSMTDLAEGSGLHRWNDWRYAATLLRWRPLAGYGLDTYMLYAVLRPKEAGERNRDFKEADPSVSDRIHNIVLDTAWNGGLVALAALAYLVFAAVRVGQRALVRNRGAGAAFLSGLVAYALANQLAFDFSISGVFVYAYLAGLAVIADSS